MTKATSAAQVIKAIGNAHLNLYKGNGYWYFTYDDETNNIWQDHSVYTMYLSHLTLEQWVAEAEELIDAVAAELKHREIFKSN